MHKLSAFRVRGAMLAGAVSAGLPAVPAGYRYSDNVDEQRVFEMARLVAAVMMPAKETGR